MAEAAAVKKPAKKQQALPKSKNDTAPPEKGLYAKLAWVVGEVQRIPKNGRNDYHGYDYVTESDLVDTLRALLSQAGIAILPTLVESVVHEKDGKSPMTVVTMEYTLVDVADPQQSVVTRWQGSAQDSGDKGLYKAYTGCEKYFLMKTFMVASGDDPERSEVRHEVKQASKKDAGSQPPRQAQPSEKSKYFNAMWARIYAVGDSLGYSKEESVQMLREQVAGYGIDSTKDLSLDQLKMIHVWLDELEQAAKNGQSDDEVYVENGTVQQDLIGEW